MVNENTYDTGMNNDRAIIEEVLSGERDNWNFSNAPKLKAVCTKIFELMAAGELESIKVGKSRRVPVEAIKDFIARQRQAQGGDHGVSFG